MTIDPDGAGPLFEVPIAGPLPGRLGVNSIEITVGAALRAGPPFLLNALNFPNKIANAQ